VTGVSGVQLRIAERNSGGSLLAQGLSAAYTPTSADLVLQLVSLPRVNTNASTAFVQPFLYLGVVNGGAVDITLRIGSPTMQLSGFALQPVS
jgi:hypothetical protein